MSEGQSTDKLRNFYDDWFIIDSNAELIFLFSKVGLLRVDGLLGTTIASICRLS